MKSARPGSTNSARVTRLTPAFALSSAYRRRSRRKPTLRTNVLLRPAQPVVGDSHKNLPEVNHFLRQPSDCDPATGHTVTPRSLAGFLECAATAQLQFIQANPGRAQSFVLRNNPCLENFRFPQPAALHQKVSKPKGYRVARKHRLTPLFLVASRFADRTPQTAILKPCHGAA